MVTTYNEFPQITSSQTSRPALSFERRTHFLQQVEIHPLNLPVVGQVTVNLNLNVRRQGVDRVWQNGLRR